MSIKASLPIIEDPQLYQLLILILQKAIDGTVIPIFVDSTNNRIIIGGTQSLGQNAPLQVQSGDMEITTAGKGVILKDGNGSGKTARVSAIYDASTGNWSLDVSGVS